MSAARAARRLPGFRFEAQAPPLDEVLPRMDIAVFVGFAASGPLETPVAIESETQFAAIFGHDAPLAWDVERGEQVYAYLGPTVRGFFRNGGQRCWVIRVARRKARSNTDLNYARCNYFPIPGLARVEFDGEGKSVTRLMPAFARARSEGSWSDSLQVGSALLSRSCQLLGITFPTSESEQAYALQIDRTTAKDLGAGDLLRMTFKAEQRFLFLAVEKVKEIFDSPPTLSGRAVEVTGSKAVWLGIVSTQTLPPPGTPAKVAVFTREINHNEKDVVAGFESIYNAVLNPQLIDSSPVDSAPPVLADKSITLKLLNCSPANAPSPGSVVRVDLTNQQPLWLTVNDLGFSAGESTTAFVSGPAFQRIAPLSVMPASMPSCERLAFELWVRKAEEYSISLSDLGFIAGHERYWGLLPSDEELYQEQDLSTADVPATVLWRQTGDLFRFPLAGSRDAKDFYLPLAMEAVPDSFPGPVRFEATELERDGLATFDSSLFIDPDLAGTMTEDLLSQADFLRYQAPRTRALTGMHAAMALEEPTIIAVPDAVHRGWRPGTRGQPPEPGGARSPARPEWWHFLDCRPSPDPKPTIADCDPQPPPPSGIRPIAEPLWGNFLNCGIRIIAPPSLFASEGISPDGTFSLTWQSSPPLGAAYVLEEATNSDFSDAGVIYSGALTNLTIYGRSDGDYFYRINATLASNTSDWSKGVAVRVASRTGFTLKKESDYTGDVLLAVQRALLRLCTVRGDLFAVLSLPEHYREDKAIEYVGNLKDLSFKNIGTERVPPLGGGELNNFSYGAVFHPWLIDRDEHRINVFRRTPPCGAASGVIAQRALQRGAWIAPANEPLRAVVALEPPINRARFLDLQEAHINLVRQEPRGFVVLDADTLSDDVDLRLINVRRLLVLLRRQALRLGMTYVFEPNSPAFRRLVERGFTDMLDQMFIRGAFAGATPKSSYQVVADDSVNTERSVEQGRFIVELRVAPSLPLNFLTIRLIQNGDRTSVREGR